MKTKTFNSLYDLKQFLENDLNCHKAYSNLLKEADRIAEENKDSYIENPVFNRIELLDINNNVFIIGLAVVYFKENKDENYDTSFMIEYQ